MNGRPEDDPGLCLWAALFAEVGRLEPGRTFLDVGGGSGLLAARVAERSGADGILLDPDAPYVPGLSSTRARADALPFAGGALDAVLFSHVLHHLSDPSAALIEAARVLTVGGHVLIRSAGHADLLALPHARWIPHLLPGVLACVPDTAQIEEWLRAVGLVRIERRTVETPQLMPLTAYAEAVAMQARRNWAMSPSGAPDPHSAAHAWALETFTSAPPVRETLLVAARA